MRPLLVLPALALTVLALTACGGGTKNTVSATTATTQTSAGGDATQARQSSAALPARDSDGDRDGSEKAGLYDKDDAGVVEMGHAAIGAEAEMITSLAKRYYAAALADNGADACSMIYSLVAESIVEDYGQNAGEASLRGKTCAAVMTKFLKGLHSRYAESASLQVMGARVEGNRGYVLLGLKSKVTHFLAVRREFGVWKIHDELEHGLP